MYSTSSTLVSVTEFSGITSAYFAGLTWRVWLRKVCVLTWRVWLRKVCVLTWRVWLRKEVHCWRRQDAKHEIVSDELNQRQSRNFFIGLDSRSTLLWLLTVCMFTYCTAATNERIRSTMHCRVKCQLAASYADIRWTLKCRKCGQFPQQYSLLFGTPYAGVAFGS